jgi:hypothetical protein
MVQLSAPYVVIEKAAEITGYTRRAIEAKIERGIWLEGQVWFRAPDGRRLISIRGFEQWVEQGSKASTSGPRRSASPSASKDGSTATP